MYQLQKLPFLYQDLEPYIDTHTVGVHHNKHEKNYLNNLNNLLTKNNYNFKYNINQLVFHINEFPIEDQENILFNLGGVLNHNLYWKSIDPKKKQKPIMDLKKELDKKYGSIDNFLKKFKESALNLKGSGYTFLILNKKNELEIMNFKNQDLPQLQGYIPLFVIDMWEHAYYLNYKNNKSDYIDNFLQIADFTFANENYNNIVKQIM